MINAAHVTPHHAAHSHHSHHRRHHVLAAPYSSTSRARRVPVKAAAAAAATPAATASEQVQVAVVGAGIAGLATAVGLHKLGVPVAVVESAPSLRQEGSALSLWSNAWRGLDALGVSQQLRQHSLPLNRVELVSSTGKLLRGFDFSECSTAAAAAGGVNETRGVSRSRLLKALADELPPGALRFNSRVTGFSNQQAGQPVLQLADGSSLSCDVLVGADGANSKLARQMGLPPLNYAGYMAYRGVAEYPGGSSLPLPPGVIRQVFGRGVRAGMYPITEQQMYWYICFNAPEAAPKPADAAGLVSEALAAVEGWSWGIQQAVRNTDSITRSSLRDRWTAGSFGQGCMTLVGDAMHPMTPNLGQGGCTAIEDAVVLARQLAPVLKRSSLNSSSSSSSSERHQQDVEACLRSFEAERARRCLPLTVRSYAFGVALQIPFEPVCQIRDLFVQNAFQPAHFLDHTAYDCGTLQ